MTTTDAEAEGFVEEGLREAKAGNTVIGLLHLEKAIEHSRSPEVCAWLGYCLARERRAFPKALELCKEAISADGKNPDLYLPLARVYLAAGRKRQAFEVLRRGLKVGRSEAIMEELQRLGVRKEPVFPFLERSNPLNIYAGLLLSKLKLR